jgi:nucleoside-diphosphate-sugar epimerase
MRRAALEDRDELARAFEGATCVVSNAGLFTLGRQDWASLESANVAGARNACEAAAEAGASRVLHVSSVAAYAGYAAPAVAEDHALYDDASLSAGAPAYGVSKAMGERAARAAAEARGLSLTIVRPAPIFGAFDRNFTPKLRLAARLPVAPAGTHLSYVYAGDVAEGIVRAIESGGADGRAYNLAGDADVTVWDILKGYAEAANRRFVRVPIPLPRRRVFDNARARAELGFRNRAPSDAWRDAARLEGWTRFDQPIHRMARELVALVSNR